MRMRIRGALSVLLLASLVATCSAFAGTGEERPGNVALPDRQPQGGAEGAPAKSTASSARGEIPPRVTSENWAYREIADLVEKYAAEKKLPQGMPCTRAELAECLLGVMDKIVKNFQQSGDRSLLKNDLEKINALQLGLEAELAADSPESYRDRAVALAGDPERLARLRRDLRPHMRRSLGDATRHVADLEDFFRRAWTGWCDSASSSA